MKTVSHIRPDTLTRELLVRRHRLMDAHHLIQPGAQLKLHLLRKKLPGSHLGEVQHAIEHAKNLLGLLQCCCGALLLLLGQLGILDVLEEAWEGSAKWNRMKRM